MLSVKPIAIKAVIMSETAVAMGISTKAPIKAILSAVSISFISLFVMIFPFG